MGNVKEELNQVKQEKKSLQETSFTDWKNRKYTTIKHNEKEISAYGLLPYLSFMINVHEPYIITNYSEIPVILSTHAIEFTFDTIFSLSGDNILAINSQHNSIDFYLITDTADNHSFL